METDPLYNRLSKLRQEINYHNYRYHVLDSPVISDAEYDQRMNELRAIENAHPEWITPDSPSQRAGGPPVEKFTKTTHPAPILSLGNAFSVEDIQAWYERVRKLDDRMEQADYVVEPKIDGLTVVLHYRNGVFTQGATRGDGEVGEDITVNLRTLRALPLKIPLNNHATQTPGYLVVRGEAYINIEDFEALNERLREDGQKTYLNPRNTAAGSLRQLDPNLTASRPLRLLVYAIVDGDDSIPTTHSETLEFLRSLGFPVVAYQHCQTLDQAINACLQGADERLELPYEVDGAVIKVNDLQLSKDLGIVGKDPRAAIAFKFPAQEVTTLLRDIGVNVGRTGVLTPYAILEPVEIGGVIVKQATLHNFDYIAEKDIRIGDRVLVKRAGDVIPYVIGPVYDARTGEEKVYLPPEKCPACGEPVEHFSGEVAWYCVNAACPAQLIRNLEHFVSRGAMDIVGLGIRIVEQLVETRLLQDVADLYNLTKEDLLPLDGFAEKKAENIIMAVSNSKQRSLDRVITALGIRGVGEVVATDLSHHYSDLGALSRSNLEDLQTIEGIGPNIAGAIVDWFNRPANQNIITKLHTAGVWPTATTQEETDQVPRKLDGLTFVITGTIAGFTRDQVKNLIESNGGKVTSSVSKKTDYVVFGENAGSKLDNAHVLGVPTINLIGLQQLIQDS